VNTQTSVSAHTYDTVDNQTLADEAGKQLPLGDEALMALGRMQEKAGKAHEARDAYDRVTKEYPTSMLRYKAQARLASLPKE